MLLDVPIQFSPIAPWRIIDFNVEKNGKSFILIVWITLILTAVVAAPSFDLEPPDIFLFTTNGLMALSARLLVKGTSWWSIAVSRFLSWFFILVWTFLAYWLLYFVLIIVWSLSQTVLCFSFLPLRSNGSWIIWFSSVL